MNRSSAVCLFAIALVSLSSYALADTITVDVNGIEGVETLQEGIAAASDGDTVLVLPGTYDGPMNRGLAFDNINLVITSTHGWEQTLIDCEGQDRAFLLSGVHDTTTIIEGFTITNGYVAEGRPEGGGAIYMHSGSSAIARDCVFDGNHADGGGAITIGTGNTAKVINCFFISNSAALVGGAIHCSYDASIIRGCDFDGNTAPDGGAVYMDQSSTNIHDCEFDDDNVAAGNGGAIYHRESSAAVIEGCTFTGNTAYDGGGLYCYFSFPEVTDCDFYVNEATNEGGGLMARADVGPGPTLSGCTFQGNTAFHGGGAEFICDSATIVGGTFDSNTAGNMGGGLYVGVLELTLTNCVFTGNSALGQGGGLRMGSMTSATISGCEFSGNHADSDGAGIVCWYGVADIGDCTFNGNTSDEEGGGLYGYEFAPNMTLCTFTANTARRGGGFGFMQNSAPVITECTIHENTASLQGGGVYWDGSSGSMRTTTIEGNSAPNGGGIYFQGEAGTIEETIVAFSTEGAGIVVSGPGPEITHCCVFGNAAGDSLSLRDAHDNMFVNPLFCDAAGDDYTLCADSSCANANNSWGLLIGAHDIGCPPCEDPVDDESWGTIKAIFRTDRHPREDDRCSAER